MQRNNTNKRCKSVTGKQIWIFLVTQNHGSDTRSNQTFAAVVASCARAAAAGAAAGRATIAGRNIRRTAGATCSTQRTFCGTKEGGSDCTSIVTFVHRSTFRPTHCSRSKKINRTICCDSTICFHRRSMCQVLASSQPKSAPLPMQQATQLAQPPLAQRVDSNLVDLPPFNKYLSDHVLASVFSEFQLSSAYQRFVAEEAWPSADDAMFLTPSLLYATACWAWQRILPKFESASWKALQLRVAIPLCALTNEKPLHKKVAVRY